MRTNSTLTVSLCVPINSHNRLIDSLCVPVRDIFGNQLAHLLYSFLEIPSTHASKWIADIVNMRASSWKVGSAGNWGGGGNYGE